MCEFQFIYINRKPRGTVGDDVADGGRSQNCRTSNSTLKNVRRKGESFWGKYTYKICK